ncbi:MAG: two-component system sensor histidine kinase/response regulator [Lysobacterales bacterium]|jgi:two-component system sensor histidine kinase/response regulator
MNNLETGQYRRILLIDDNRAVHADFRKILATRDETSSALDAAEVLLFGGEEIRTVEISFEVDSAYQGQEGVERVKQAMQDGRPYALAIVDMRMPPGWDGVVTAKKIWEIDPDIQVVICTAYSDYSWKDMLEAIGAGDRMVVLKKPFEPIEAFQLAKMLSEKWWLHRLARQKVESLEQMVVERTRALDDTNHELRQRSEEIQYFYHTLSHELKTPLTAALEFTSIVIDGLAGDLNEDQSKYLNIAHESCSHLAIYVNDLLDMTRLDTGKMSLNRQPVALGPLILRVQTIMQTEAAKKKIHLNDELESGLEKMVVDKSRIMQILINLYNNALKFTPEGGSILVKLYQDPQRPEWVEISLTDTGCGINQDQIEYLFRRYYQVDSTSPTQSEGFGLGLYLCHELMKLHGGKIHVESEPGKGSTFILSLPATLESTKRAVKKAQISST